MSKKIRVRASVNLPGLARGTVVRVNPDDPYMRALIEGQKLVPVGKPSSPPQ